MVRRLSTASFVGSSLAIFLLLECLLVSCPSPAKLRSASCSPGCPTTTTRLQQTSSTSSIRAPSPDSAATREPGSSLDLPTWLWLTSPSLANQVYPLEQHAETRDRGPSHLQALRNISNSSFLKPWMSVPALAFSTPTFSHRDGEVETSWYIRSRQMERTWKGYGKEMERKWKGHGKDM